MKKIAIVLCMMCSVAYYAQQEGFRMVKWGSDLSTIKGLENAELRSENPDKLTYNGSVVGYDAEIEYVLCQSTLFKGSYHFSNIHEDGSFYIGDYDEIKELLKQKYGDPVIDDVNWDANEAVFKASKNKKGEALLAGDLSFKSVWVTPETIIELKLSADTYKVRFRLDYNSKKLSKIAQEFRQQQLLKYL